MSWREPCEHCGKRTACAHYPTAPTGFYARVNLAAKCLRDNTGIGSRGYDACFEQGDGDFVVAALDRMAAEDFRLREAIYREWSNLEARQCWARTVTKLEQCRDLAKAAERYRNSPTQAASWRGQMELF